MAEQGRWRVVVNLIWSGTEVASSVMVSLVALLGIARLIGAAEFGRGTHASLALRPRLITNALATLIEWMTGGKPAT